MAMNDREKIINGLECCRIQQNEVPPICEACPYADEAWGTCEDMSGLLNDAYEMLKAQQPRVMAPADVTNIGPEDVCAFVEIREETHMYACYMRQYDETHTEIMCDVPDLMTKLQNGCARLWTSRPTDEQRKAVKWE